MSPDVWWPNLWNQAAFESDESEAALLVDATNTFNALNCQAALLNVINSYRSPTELFVDGDVILSQEGTTQRAMPMYGLATIPLIGRLDGLCKQIWYGGDSAAIGTVEQLHDWLNRLAAVGPVVRCFPNPSKTWLVTK